MALEMRPECERYLKKLNQNEAAYICTYECTFCPECTAEMQHVCPNCSGELVQRPRANMADG